MYTAIAKLNIGPISQVFLIKKVHRGETKTKEPYTGLHLIDTSGEIKALIWRANIANVRPGFFVQLSGDIKLNKENKLQIFANKESITPVKAPENLCDYIKAIDELTKDRLKAEFETLTNEITDEHILGAIKEQTGLKNDSGFDFYNCPLSIEGGENYCGALLEHTVYSLRYAKEIYLKSLDRSINVNKDLLFGIVALSNIGEINALELNGLFIEANIQGILLGSAESSILQLASSKSGSALNNQLFSMICHGIIACNDFKMPAKFVEAYIAQEVVKLSKMIGMYGHYAKFIKFDKKQTDFIKALNTEIIAS